MMVIRLQGDFKFGIMIHSVGLEIAIGWNSWLFLTKKNKAYIAVNEVAKDKVTGGKYGKEN